MAWPDTEGPNAAAKGLSFDAILADLVPNLTDMGDLFFLTGVYIGPSPQQYFYRLYLNRDLSEYYEISEDDIVWAASAGDQRRVWVTYGAPIRYVERRPGRAEANFLSGALARELTRTIKAGEAFDWEAAGTEPTKCGPCNTR